MINANELRIGNLLLIGNDIKPVQGVDDYGNIKTCGYYPLIELKPIPLTEEILLKCGFEKKGQNNHAFIAYDINDIYRIYLEKGEYGFWILDRDYEDTSYCRLSELKYLHQLQNLYFALTSRELVYTP